MKKAGFLLIILCFIAVSFVQAKIADDPIRIGAGARPLGLGKAYVGLADDVNAIFLNPAGLTQINHPQAASLSGRLLNEITYFNAGAVLPTLKGVLAIGYLGSDFGFTASATTIEAGRVTTTNESVSYADADSVLLLSYALPLDGLFNWKLFNKLSFGTTLKLFSKKLSGGTITAGSAYGRDLDVGVMLRPHEAVKLGLVAQNVLPESMGGKIIWETGAVETLPLLIKGGTSVKVIGENGLYFIENQRLLVNFDADYCSELSRVPVLFHLGAEWSPQKFLDIRFGVDQETAGPGTVGLAVANNLSAGIGLKRGKFRFDYAYHQYDAFPQMSNHFFSISYGLFDEEDVKLQAARLERERIERERLERERKERERLLREQKERERKERGIFERQKKQRERLEKQRLEEEKKKLEEEKKKKEEEERIKKQREWQRQAQERAKRIREFGANFFGGIGNAVVSSGKAVGGAFGAAGENIQSAGSNFGSAFAKLFQPPPRPRPAPRREGEKPKEVLPEKKTEIQSIAESITELGKIFTGERPLEDLGVLIPQIATSFLVLALKVGVFLFVLFVILILFKEWERRTQ